MTSPNAAPSPTQATRSAPLSPRRRRLRWTVGILSGAFTLGLGAVVIWQIATRPAPYRPDERPADITSSLTQQLPADAPTPRFTDVTRPAGLAAFRTFNGDRSSQLPEDMGPGCAWGDFDNDGDDDLFLVSQGGSMRLPPDQWAPCELYENLGDGTFRRVAEFPDTRILGLGAAWGDFDGDGWLDLVVTGYNALLLFHNEPAEQGRKFVRDARLPNLKGFWSGAAWGDFDQDRDLDLYVCNYVQYVENEADIARGEVQQGVFVPFTLNPNSYPGGVNALFRNNGDGTFTDVAAELNVTNPEGRSLGALWHDFDDDGWLDLYVANDVSDNVFYRNVGGRFEDISHPALVADYRSAMGLAVGDYNRDGDDDLFITHWVAQENALYDNLLADFGRKAAPANLTGNANQTTSEPATVNTALAGPSTHPISRSPADQASDSSSLTATLQQAKAPPASPLRFMDFADLRGLGQIALQSVGWGTEFVDLDGDGWLDLVVANGNTLEFPGPIPRQLKPQAPFLFWNQRGEHFFDLAPRCPPLAQAHVSRGLAVADFDDDGAMDVLFNHHGEGAQLLRNEMQTGHWLKVRLRSRLHDGRPLGFAEGTKVIAHVGDAVLRRAVSSASYLSQSSRTLHFGLGRATKVDRLEVRWHAGAVEWFDDLAADATWEIIEGNPTPRRRTRPEAGASLTGREGPTPATGGAGAEPVRLVSGAAPAGGGAPGSSLAASPGSAPAATGADASRPDRSRELEFWQHQRAAMNAMKRENDFAKAIPLFRAALALNPRHEDARYYLAHCLAEQGDVPSALAELEQLQRLNPRSHRAFQQWGRLRALSAKNAADLAAAERALEQAHALNPEETGALHLLGEIALLRGDFASAEARLSAVCRTNPRSVGALFLRGYRAWRQGDPAAARSFLAQARQALGPNWQPQGATSEGDVRRKQHVEATPLARFWEEWNGAPEPDASFQALDAFLKTRR